MTPNLISSSVLPAAALLAALAASPALAQACDGADDMPIAHQLSRARGATRCLLNQERTAHGLPALSFNAELTKAAQAYARSMVSRRFFDHVSPGGSTLVGRVRSAGYGARGSGWILGENLAWGSGALATPRATMRAWMKSPGHRHNILDPRFREVGIGIASGAPVQWGAGLAAATYTTDFGARRGH
jgi:uncharacterized protein YkwD